MMQPLSEAMAQHNGGGTCLPGGLRIKVLFYADDIFLVAESEDELRAMLSVCERWATSIGLRFNVPKSKLMVLAGKLQKNQQLPEVLLDGQPLAWVDRFKYLGFPLYGSTVRQPQHYPLDMTLLNPVLYPLTSVLMPNQMAQLHLLSRVRVLTTMVESKVLHNSPLLDLDYKAMDCFLNRWLAVACGMSINATSATFLRCELGVLPAQLVAERNALYFLWHLSHETWFREHLPQLIHLHPLRRLTNMVISYGLSCEQLYLMDLPAWRKAVKQAVLHKALFFYEPKQSLAAVRLPGFIFEYLGRQYLHHDCISDLADLAVQLRADRLPGVPQPYEYHPCLWCGRARGLNGLHLLQCSAMPSSLAQERQQLRAQLDGATPLGTLANLLVACQTEEQAAQLTRQGLLFFRKTSQAVKKQLWTAATRDETNQVVDSLVQLFSIQDHAFAELETAVTNDQFPV
jgi:Reverse transcriptase (RNA-dependent DNA polymerase)